MPPSKSFNRRTFIKATSGAAALAISGLSGLHAQETTDVPVSRKLRIGVIGCGSVSEKYLPDLTSQPFIDIVSACDIRKHRAEKKANEFGIPNVYGNIEEMLAGVDFEFLVDLTSMPAHYEINKRGLQAGKHVWSEKPLAKTVEQGKELIELAKARGVGFWAAPAMVISPKFHFMADVLAQKKLGRVCAAHAFYGHSGWQWLWAPEFFMDGGGSLFDLGVYNVITLTGLLGPVSRVAGIWSIVHPEVTVTTHEGEKVSVKVETDENAMLLMEHENGVLTHVQTGFSYFDQMQPHDTIKDDLHSIEIIGDEGMMKLVGFDWGPIAVDLSTMANPKMERYALEPEDFRWQMGASYIADCILTGKKPLITAEHALHALEIMNACRKSGKTGRYVNIETRFKWPVGNQA